MVPVLVPIVKIIVAVLPVLADLVAVVLPVLAALVAKISARREPVLKSVAPLLRRAIGKLAGAIADVRSASANIRAIAKPRQQRNPGSRDTGTTSRAGPLAGG